MERPCIAIPQEKWPHAAVRLRGETNNCMALPCGRAVTARRSLHSMRLRATCPSFDKGLETEGLWRFIRYLVSRHFYEEYRETDMILEGPARCAFRPHDRGYTKSPK